MLLARVFGLNRDQLWRDRFGKTASLVHLSTPRRALPATSRRKDQTMPVLNSKRFSLEAKARATKLCGGEPGFMTLAKIMGEMVAEGHSPYDKPSDGPTPDEKAAMERGAEISTIARQLVECGACKRMETALSLATRVCCGSGTTEEQRMVEDARKALGKTSRPSGFGKVR